MTPERRKYINGISEEERVIRCTIESHKCFMRDDKSFLNDSKCTKKDRKAFLTNIHCRKILIKNLKKQLSAPRKNYTDEVCDYIGCPICYFEIDKDYPCYCSECGQKLR